VLVMGPVIGTPVETGIFKSTGTKNECEQLDGPFGLK